VQHGADAEPEHRDLVEADVARQRAGVVGDALAMAARVGVFGLDVARPTPDDDIKAILEPSDAALQVGEIALGAQPREETM